MLHFGRVLIVGDCQDFEDLCVYLGISTTTTTSDTIDKVSDQMAPVKQENTISKWLESSTAVHVSDTDVTKSEMSQLQTAATYLNELFNEGKDVIKGMFEAVFQILRLF